MVGGLSRRSRRRGGLTRGGCAAVLAALALIATACGAEVDFEAQQADFADEAQDAFDAAIERRAEADDAEEEEESQPPPTADPAISSTPASSQSDFCTASADVFVAATAFGFLETDDSPYRTSVAATQLTTSIDAAIAAAPDAQAAAPAEALAASWLAIQSSLETDYAYDWVSYDQAGAGEGDLAQFGEIAGTALADFLANECAITTQDQAEVDRQVQSLLDAWAGVGERFVVVDDNGLIELSLPYEWQIDNASDQTVAWVHAAPVLADAETTWDADGVFFTMFPVNADVSAEDWMESAIASSLAAQDCEEDNFIRNPGSFEAYFVCIGPEVDAIVVDGGEVGAGELSRVSSSDGRVSVSVPIDWQSDEQPGDRQYSWILSPDITAASESGRIGAVRFVFVEELDELDGWLEFSRQGNAQVRRGCVETGDASVAEGDVLRTTFLYDCDGAPAVVVSLFDARAPSGLLIQVQSSDDRSQDEALDWIEETLDSVMWTAPAP